MHSPIAIKLWNINTKHICMQRQLSFVICDMKKVRICLEG